MNSSTSQIVQKSSLKALKIRRLLSDVVKQEVALTPEFKVTYISMKTKPRLVRAECFSDASTEES